MWFLDSDYLNQYHIFDVPQTQALSNVRTQRWQKKLLVFIRPLNVGEVSHHINRHVFWKPWSRVQRLRIFLLHWKLSKWNPVWYVVLFCAVSRKFDIVWPILMGIAGANLTVDFMILQGIINPKGASHQVKRKFHAAFSTVMIILLTVDFSTSSIWGEEMWISHRDSPGGVPSFIMTEGSIWYKILGMTATYISTLFANMFMVRVLSIDQQ